MHLYREWQTGGYLKDWLQKLDKLLRRPHFIRGGIVKPPTKQAVNDDEWVPVSGSLYVVMVRPLFACCGYAILFPSRISSPAVFFFLHHLIYSPMLSPSHSHTKPGQLHQPILCCCLAKVTLKMKLNLQISFLKFVKASKHRPDENAKTRFASGSFDRKIFCCFCCSCHTSVIIGAAVVCGFLGFAITVANILVIVIFCFRPHGQKRLLNNSQVVYKISLAVADLLVGVIVLPTLVVNL